MDHFYLTFGVQYRHTPHPHWEGANPDGWVKIMAPDETAARALAMRHFGPQWSMLTDAAHFPEAAYQRDYYPAGQLATISATGGVLSLIEGVGAPTPIHPQYPAAHGRDDDDIVAVRIEGHLKVAGSDDMYDVELFHEDCAYDGEDLFAEVTAYDRRVLALELDWTNLPTCPVCQKEIR